MTNQGHRAKYCSENCRDRDSKNHNCSEQKPAEESHFLIHRLQQAQQRLFGSSGLWAAESWVEVPPWKPHLVSPWESEKSSLLHSAGGGEVASLKYPEISVLCCGLLVFKEKYSTKPNLAWRRVAGQLQPPLAFLSQLKWRGRENWENWGRKQPRDTDPLKPAFIYCMGQSWIDCT